MTSHARRNALAVAFLLEVAATATAQTEVRPGALDSSDGKLDTGEFVEEFQVQPPQGQSLVVTLVSLDFDPFLIVAPPQGDQIENDDLGDSRDVAQVVASVDQTGPWTIRVTSSEPGATGNFVVLWRSVPADQATRTARKQQEGTLNVAEMEPDGTMAGTEPTRAFEGELEQGDKQLPSTEWFDLYVVEAATGETLTFALASEDFDPYLAVASPSGQVTENDDDGQTTNSRVEVQVAENGRWYAIVTSAAPLLKGDYQLTVTRGS